MIRRKLVYPCLLLLLAFLLSEGLSFWIAKSLQKKSLFYEGVAGDYDRYLSLRHPLLGWPSSSKFGSGAYDKIGARRVPDDSKSSDTRAFVSLYGDSFTWGAQVRADQTWGHLLAQRLGRRVNNFGVGGYGSDQSFLRFLHNERDDSPIVILGHLAENILRNLNQFQDLLYNPGGIGFKPRFILDSSGSALLIPLPTPSKAEYLECVKHPGKYLEHEEFLPGSPSGPKLIRFPFTWSLLSLFQHYHVRAKIRGEPRHMQFYRRDHPAQGTLITAEILMRFYHESLSRDRSPVVHLIPTGLDLEYFKEHQAWPYEPLLEELSARSIPFLNSGPALIEKIGNRGVDRYFVGDTSHHFNPAGNRLLAEAVHDHLRANGLVP